MKLPKEGPQKVDWIHLIRQVLRYRQWEHGYPYVLAAVTGGAFWVIDPSFPEGNLLFSATLTLASLFIGFLATATSILLGLNSEIMRRIRNSSYIKDLASYLDQSLGMCFALIGVAVSGFFVEDPAGVFGCVWIGALVAAALSVSRLIRLLLGLMQHTE